MIGRTSSPDAPEGLPLTAKTAKRKVPSTSVKKKPSSFFKEDPVTLDIVQDEEAENSRHKRLLRFVQLETIIIAVLVGIFLVAMPFFLPIYQYYAKNPQDQTLQMIGLTMPNMTNRAVLSWATTSITEIMTIGFGDFETKLGEQKSRFTREGWDDFVEAFLRQKIGESFKKNQLVLTTVPSNTPVIVAQGINDKHVYQWRVQMPVIMTYATNNNIARHEKAVIDLTIVRVSPEQNPSGIGIDNWSLKN